MKLYAIPPEVRQETYVEDGEVIEGDNDRCGGCNWDDSEVFLLGNSQEEANEAFRENHRGLCGRCMAEMLAEGGYEITKTE